MLKILFYPSYPDKEFYAITHLINLNGYAATRDLNDDFDVAFLWQDATKLNCPEELEQACGKRKIINQACVDISKRHVETLHQQVFGYGCALDPTTAHGLGVEKPDANGVKGGKLVSLPLLAPQADKVYQQLIDSTVDGYQQEYRVAIVFDEIASVCLVRQQPATELLDHREQLPPEPVAVQKVFSTQEQRLILSFCACIRLDFGELDIVRCRHSQRIYILDANKTAAGYGMLNYFKWRAEDKKAVLKRIAECFAHHIECFLHANKD
ncbi:hypothetical protein ACFOEE_06585 [Pseudoalteromonas fenneropenaei]|uniref:ATP-grasp domain-containing protein n=1 Tax=Pseudoalteromonas fenneropenaei TaxID=1737459 RepID=A0ABV7CHU6_9GAMM